MRQGPQYSNPAAYTYEEQAKIKRRHRRKDGCWNIHPLCNNGYHQPYHPGGGDSCERTGCQCFCHHPLEVAAYVAREGMCRACGGTGKGEPQAPGSRYYRTCHLCFGSGYSGGRIVTMARPATAVESAAQ